MAVKLYVRIGSSASPVQNRTAVEQFLCTAIEDSLAPNEIAEAIGMPQGTVIKYEFSNNDRLVDTEGVVHVKLAVRASADLAEFASSDLEANVGDLVLERLDGMAITNWQHCADQDVPDRPTQLRFEVSDSLPKQISSAELAENAGFKPGTVLGWSKGCNSWPG